MHVIEDRPVLWPYILLSVLFHVAMVALMFGLGIVQGLLLAGFGSAGAMVAGMAVTILWFWPRLRFRRCTTLPCSPSTSRKFTGFRP